MPRDMKKKKRNWRGYNLETCYDLIINECLQSFPQKIRDFLDQDQLEIFITNDKLCNQEDCYGYIDLKKHQIILRERKNVLLFKRSFYHEIAHYLDYYFFDFEKFYSKYNNSFQKACDLDKHNFRKMFFFTDKNVMLDLPEVFAYIFSYYMLQWEKEYKNKVISIQDKCSNLWSEIDNLIIRL